MAEWLNPNFPIEFLYSDIICNLIFCMFLKVLASHFDNFQATKEFENLVHMYSNREESIFSKACVIC